MKNLIFFFFVLLMGNSTWAQSSGLQLSFAPTFGGEPLVLDTSIGAKDMVIESFRCYISQLELYNGNTPVYAEKNSFHLLDAAVETSLMLSLDVPEGLVFDVIHFSVGIDSLTHEAGVFGGDLDPMHGMYWTWQSGYLNVKLEGSANNCPGRNNKFSLHLGGYQQAFNALQMVSLALKQTDEIEVTIAIDDFLRDVNLQENYRIMSPGNKAVKAAQLFATIFQVR